jgi:hypothetical protein
MEKKKTPTGHPVHISKGITDQSPSAVSVCINILEEE